MGLASQSGLPSPRVSLRAPIDFLPVSYLDPKYQQHFVPYLINHTVVLSRPHVHPIKLLLRLQLLHSMRTRILFQAKNVTDHFLSDVRIEFANISFSGGG
jgi:hypothetical protein